MYDDAATRGDLDAAVRDVGYDIDRLRAELRDEIRDIRAALREHVADYHNSDA